MHMEGEKHFYEVKTKRDHVHLACFRCGRIEEYSSPLFERLKAEISKQSGFAIRVTRLEAGGYCRACCRGKYSSQQEDAGDKTIAETNRTRRVSPATFAKDRETRKSTTRKVGDPLIIRPPAANLAATIRKLIETRDRNSSGRIRRLYRSR